MSQTLSIHASHILRSAAAMSIAFALLNKEEQCTMKTLSGGPIHVLARMKALLQNSRRTKCSSQERNLADAKNRGIAFCVPRPPQKESIPTHSSILKLGT